MSIKNFNNLQCLVFEISSFEFNDYRGFHAGAVVHKLSVGGVFLLNTVV